MPGIGPVVAATIRACFGDGRQFPDAKAAQSSVGLCPSNRSSGTVSQPWRGHYELGVDARVHRCVAEAASGLVRTI